jgi:hypothetical protein
MGNRQMKCKIQSVQNVQAVQPLRSVQTPASILPRDAGEDEGGGLIDLNGLNVLNGFSRSYLHSSTDTVF